MTDLGLTKKYFFFLEKNVVSYKKSFNFVLEY